MNLKDYIASIPNYPSEGIIFRDISPLMADGEAYRVATHEIVEYAKEKQIDKIKQVSVAPLIGDAIKRINENRPVSPLFKQVFQSAQLEKK